MITDSKTTKKKRRKKQDVPTIRCAIYTRKSSEEGLDSEFNSLDAQREAAEAFIASQKAEGWECLPEQYDDGGFSGGNVERPGLKRLLADIEAGRIDCVVVYKVDRLSRSLMDFARMMEVFEKHDISFVSVTQQFNTTHSMGRLTLNILLSFAQFEREIIGERIRDKIAAQRRRGKWAGGNPVLGYDIDRSGPSPKLAINATEAKRVRKIFDLYLRLGSLLSVVEELEKRGWKNKAWTTKGGKPMGGNALDRGCVYNLLTNPIYIGKIKHKSDVYDGEHKSIVKEDVYWAVQAQLRQNRIGSNSNGKDPRHRNKNGALLRGLLFCKTCGCPRVHTYTPKGNKRYRYYRCSNELKKGRRACPARSLPAAEIEQAVVDEIRIIGQDPGLRKQVWQMVQTHTETERKALETERRDLEQQIKRAEREIQRVTTTGDQSPPMLKLLAELNETVARSETRLWQVKAELAALEQQCVTRAEVDAALADFDNVWNELTPLEQIHLLNQLVERVEFDEADNSLAITFLPTSVRALARGEEG